MKKWRTLTGTGLTIVVTAIALLTLGLRLAGGSATSNERTLDLTAAELSQLAEEGQLVGPSDADITIIAFSTPICEFDRLAHQDLEGVAAQLGIAVRISYRHFPGGLESRGPGYSAALALTCAAEQGAFGDFKDFLYTNHTVLDGTRTWSELANEGGLADVDGFVSCVGRQEIADLIDRDIIAAESLGLSSTPSFVIGNRLIEGYPNRNRMGEVIMEASLETAADAAVD